MSVMRTCGIASSLSLATGLIACGSGLETAAQNAPNIQTVQQESPPRGNPDGQRSNDDRARNDNMGAPNMGRPRERVEPLDIDMSPLTDPSQTARCKQISASVEAAGFSDKVEIECGGGHAYIIANTVPDHEVLTGIIKTNEQTVVPGEGFTQIVQLTPELTNIPLTRDASLAVAVNGVPIYDYTGGGEMDEDMLAHHQARHDTLLTHQLDICGGHAGRADDYHYHVTPNCMIEMMDNKDEPDAIIGWAYDGFPIFRDAKPDGTPIAQAELDICNGMTDNQYGYRYHTSETAPYIIQCLMGKVENIKRFPKIGPPHLKGNPSQGKSAGFPPRDGVEGLTFTTLDDGTKSLDYSYHGKAYFIRYTESETPRCYHYTQQTITENGALITGEYCR